MAMRFSLFMLLFFSCLGAREIIFGVVPQQSPLKLQKAWAPVAAYLSEATGYTVRFKTESSIPKFEEALYAGRYDMAYMNPYHYVVAHEKQGYEAKVRADKLLRGILVVPKEADNDIASLRGKTILFPAPYAFAATLVTKYELKKRFGIDVEREMKVLYVNSHDSVYKGVARGIGDVGGGINRTFNNLSDTQSKSSLRVLYTTEAYPSHPIGIKPSLPAGVQKALVDAWLSIPEELIRELRFVRMRPTDDGEYDVIRNLAAVLDRPEAP
jgi:phosphonate transport system substrate-binding protein